MPVLDTSPLPLKSPATYANGTSALAEGAPRVPTPMESPAQDAQQVTDNKWRDEISLEHLEDPELRDDVLRMLDKHAKMWDGSLGDIKATEHRIDLKPDTNLVRAAPYRMGPTRRQLASEEINKMLAKGVIEPATSEWASPIVLVPKKDGQLRFCVDYRKLNELTVTDAYPLPRMDDCMDSLGDAAVFTTLDCNFGYWQIPVAERDRDATTFTSHMGTYRFTRMPFGLKNAPATFQRALDIILSGVRWQTCLIYLDDVIVFSKTHDDHILHVDQVLELLRTAGVTLKLPKCHFFQPKVDYLGHVIMPGKLAIAGTATAAIREAIFPVTPTQMRSFLGSCNVFRRFVLNYAKVARPLTEMLTKDGLTAFGESAPTEDQLEAYERLKQALVNPPVLALPKLGKPYIVDTDAYAYQVGCTLLQEQGDDTWLPVGYWSQALNKAEQGYSPTERECLAVVWAVTTLRPYIERTRFVVRTDHNALRWLMNINDPTGRLVRWRLRLSEFDYTIVYRPGRVHQVPDALSRVPTNGGDTAPLDDAIPCLVVGPTPSDGLDNLDEEDPDFFDPYRARAPESSRYSKTSSVLLIRRGPLPRQFAPIEASEWLEEQRADEFCQNVLARQSAAKDSAFFEDEDGLLRRKATLDNAIQMVVPKSLRPRLLAMSHQSVIAGHPGQNKMYETMRRTYYWLWYNGGYCKCKLQP